MLRFTPAAGAFQLVVIAYVHLPGGERRVVLAHAASALSPSGILFMVGHARRKIRAYHRFVWLGCIAQGLLQLLTVHTRPSVWTRFRSWLRTMHPEQPRSELVVAQALRTSLPEYLAAAADCGDLAKFLTPIRSPDLLRAYEPAA